MDSRNAGFARSEAVSRSETEELSPALQRWVNVNHKPESRRDDTRRVAG